MPSITPMMSAILRELALISSMVETTPRTTSPPREARSAALAASALAWRAFSELLVTVEVICSMLAAVFSSDADCCSVRDDRSRLPLAISCAPVLTASELLRTWRTVCSRLARMRATADSSRPSSLRPPSFTCTDRSPSATRVSTPTASLSGVTTNAESA